VTRGPRIGVVVLDFGRPVDAERAASSARDPDLDVRVLVVENGAAGVAAPSPDRLRLPENRGFAGGMNAGLERLLADGCDRILLLNSDAVLEPDALRLLAEALDDPALAAVGPLVLRAHDGRVESRGASLDLRWGRVRLEGHGEEPGEGSGRLPAEALSGAAIMLSRAAVERVGLLDEEYFFSFEEMDWCVRARRAGYALAVVPGARVRHAGSQTIGRASPRRFYYAARNHVRLVEKLAPMRGARHWARRAVILGLNLGHALAQDEAPRLGACRAVLDGFRDARLRRFGAASG
jgi:GT2 family glycosyltransferase